MADGAMVAVQVGLAVRVFVAVGVDVSVTVRVSVGVNEGVGVGHSLSAQVPSTGGLTESALSKAEVQPENGRLRNKQTTIKFFSSFTVRMNFTLIRHEMTVRKIICSSL